MNGDNDKRLIRRGEKTAITKIKQSSVRLLNYSKPLLNARYERFSQEYLKDPNATKAAKKAKYSKKTAYSQGQRLLKNVEIKGRIKYLQRKAADKAGVTAEMITEEFKKIAFGKVSKKLTNKNKISALENLGKHMGYYEKDNEQKKDNLADFLKAFRNE